MWFDGFPGVTFDQFPNHIKIHFRWLSFCMKVSKPNKPHHFRNPLSTPFSSTTSINHIPLPPPIHFRSTFDSAAISVIECLLLYNCSWNFAHSRKDLVMCPQSKTNMFTWTFRGRGGCGNAGAGFGPTKIFPTRSLIKTMIHNSWPDAFLFEVACKIESSKLSQQELRILSIIILFTISFIIWRCFQQTAWALAHTWLEEFRKGAFQCYLISCADIMHTFGSFGSPILIEFQSVHVIYFNLRWLPTKQKILWFLLGSILFHGFAISNRFSQLSNNFMSFHGFQWSELCDMSRPAATCGDEILLPNKPLLDLDWLLGWAAWACGASDFKWFFIFWWMLQIVKDFHRFSQALIAWFS